MVAAAAAMATMPLVAVTTAATEAAAATIGVASVTTWARGKYR